MQIEIVIQCSQCGSLLEYVFDSERMILEVVPCAVCMETEYASSREEGIAEVEE